MTIREMEVFLEVARTGNMTEAGKALYLSQSTVSQTVLAIEREYGVRLFERRGRRLKITRQGELLRGYCAQLLALHRRMDYELRHSGEKLLRIGTNLVTARSFFGAVLERYHLLCPDVQTSVSVEENGALALKLHSFELDSVLLDGPLTSPELICTKVGEDEFLLVCGRGSPLYGREAISLAELCGEKLLLLPEGNPTRQRFEAFFAEKGLHFAVGAFANIDVIKTMAAANAGYAILARGQIYREEQEGTLHGLRLLDGDFYRGYYEIHHRELRDTALLKPFLTACASGGGTGDAAAPALF